MKIIKHGGRTYAVKVVRGKEVWVYIPPKQKLPPDVTIIRSSS